VFQQVTLRRIPKADLLEKPRMPRYPCRMKHVIEVTDQELLLVSSALRAFLMAFGHDEADLQRAIKQIIAKLPDIEPEVTGGPASSP
jgi:hypothetical protein